MSKFYTSLDLRQIGDDEWQLLDPVKFELGNDLEGMSIDVPDGFKTDLASIPRIFWDIMPPFGSYSLAAVVHDYLYATQPFTRAVCDSILFDAMTACGVAAWKRWVIYLCVRVGGWAAWKSDRVKYGLK